MFQLSLRDRVHTLLRNHSGQREFRARSLDRDVDTDRARIASIMAALEAALGAAEREKSGLSGRVDDALARAAVTQGNNTDEYLERDALDDHLQSLLSLEISNGERRLGELATMISHFKFIKTAMLTRFSDSNPPSVLAPFRKMP